MGSTDDGSAPLRAPSFRAAVLASAITLALALGAAGVRVLPWTFDPTVPWAVVVPFARALAVVATEAAILVGWPLGWSLAMVRFVDRGEGRVLALLGESPERTLTRLLPQGLVLALVLGAASFLGGRDARAPGRIVDDLLVGGREACLTAKAPEALTVPFLDAAWLCGAGRAPRLVAESPVGAALVSAADARIAADFRSLELDDARFELGPKLAASTSPSRRLVQVHVAHLALTHLPPWARASILPAPARAALMGISGLLSAIFAGYTILRVRLRTRIAAIAYGASGPLGALGALRWLERSDAAVASWFLLVPLAPVVVIALLELLRRAGVTLAGRTRLPSRGPAAS